MSQRLTLGELLSNLKNIKATPRDALAAFSVAPDPAAQLLGLLHDFAGFRGNEHLQRKLAKVFASMSAEELARWVASLAADPSRSELLALIEDLTNHETYFFRDPPQLDMLAQHVLPALVRSKISSGDRTLRIWSAACSTGEEVWTLLIMVLQVLLDLGEAREPTPGEVALNPGWRLELLGTDISRQAIRVARGATYRTESMASFRNFPPQYLRFFESASTTGTRGQADPSYRRLRAGLHRHVRFETFNLLTAYPPCRDIDLLVCRNVLIYLDTSTYPAIQRMLHSALRPGGYLLLGIVDRLHAREAFRDHWYGRSVIYERK